MLKGSWNCLKWLITTMTSQKKDKENQGKMPCAHRVGTSYHGTTVNSAINYHFCLYPVVYYYKRIESYKGER